MSTSAKIWLIIAAFLIVFGTFTFALGMSGHNWDFLNLSTSEYETSTISVNEGFDSISINTDIVGIEFVRSSDGTCKAECYEKNDAKHTVIVRDKTLVIERTDKKKWVDYIGINVGSPKITLYLPETEYASVSLKCTTGDVYIPGDFSVDNATVSVTTGDVRFDASASDSIKIHGSTGIVSMQDISASTLDVSVSTGMVTLTNVNCDKNIQVNVTTGKTLMTNISCQSFFSNGDTGDIKMKDVIASKTFSIERSTGDVKFIDCDAAEIHVETDTGDVRGTLLSEKRFYVDTDTGNVEVPRSDTGGKCEIETDTGDVIIHILE